jgi:hypothetical protein
MQRIPLILLGLVAAYLVAAALGWFPADSRACRGGFVLFGLFALSGTLLRPAWFWNSRRARWGRAVLGDRIYGVFLNLLAFMLVYMGLFSNSLDRCIVT